MLTGLTAREFADRIGVSHGTITNAELDKRAVRPITIKAWALATGVDVEWLERGTTMPRPGGPAGAVGTAECAIKDSNLEPTDSEPAAAAREADVLPLHRPAEVPAAASAPWTVAA